METQQSAPRAEEHPCPNQHGDEEILYRRHAAALRKMLRRRFNPDLADDACQYAWAELLRYQPDRDHVFGWLAVVARRRAVKLAERARREIPAGPIGIRDGGGLIEIALGDQLPAPTSLDETLRAREALATVAALPERQAEAVTDLFAGYSAREAARRRGRTERQIRRHRERAAARLAA